MSRVATIKYPAPIAQFISHIRIPLYRNAYALMFSSAATSVLGIAYWVLAARFYPADVVGVNSAVIAATALLAGISGLYLDGALVRFIPRAGRATAPLIGYSYLISQALSAVVGVIFLIGVNVWSPALGFLNGASWLAVSFVGMVMTLSLFAIQDAVLTGLREAVWVPIENGIFSIAKIVLLIIFAQTFPQYGILASYTIPAFVLIFPVNFLIFRYLIPRHRKATRELAQPVVPGEIARYVGGIYFGYLFSLTATRLLPIMVIQQAGNSATAYFYLPFTITLALQLVTTNMTSSLTVEGSLDQSKLGAYVRQSLVHILRLLAPAAAIFVIGAPQILQLFGGSYAAEGADLLRLLALAIVPNVFVSMFIAVARVQRRVKEIIMVHASLFVLVLGLSYILLQLYGIIGVGIGWFVSQSLVGGFLWFVGLRPILRSASEPILQSRVAQAE